ncbi:putative HTH-type transcriptional regulator [Methylobacterium trifolii]|uniref:HTH-type transcriptional regulator n=1 Tax=Methylobacterium trifolii TaxID=1003092 RepID=A0ABQ4U277_9HYPH|nr:putative HTH-type transcriptional regulator [Methylobacterium trifolii]
MKVSRKQVEENRSKVLEAAAMLFRERGLEGIGIADLMKAAGLTHGGFYRQFKSKGDFVVEAVRRAYETSSDEIRERIGAPTGDPFATLVRYYVSEEHRDHPGAGCSLATLAVDASRSEDPALRSFFGTIVSRYLDLLVTIMPGEGVADRRSAAVAALSEMVGAVILSRVVPDPSLSREILDSVADDLLAAAGDEPD